MNRNAGGLLLPRSLPPGSTIGVFSPSVPAHLRFADKYRHGLAQLAALGFRVVESPLLRQGADEGYRTADGRRRAASLMALIRDPEVDAVVSSIGGYNSSSLVRWLDLDLIRASRKPLCGYSDVTALHLAWAKAGLASWYGPAVMPSFGEWPTPPKETTQSFLAAARGEVVGPWRPTRWSNHFRDAVDGSWRSVDRIWNPDAAWTTVQPGVAEGPLWAFNLNTLCAMAGTPFWPDFRGRVLLLEQASSTPMVEERRLQQLAMMGVFEEVVAVLVGRREQWKDGGSSVTVPRLLREVVPSSTPIVLDVDCSHTVPMATLAQGTAVRVHAEEPPWLEVLEPMSAADGGA